MKKYLKALWEGFGVAFSGFGTFILPMFAIYVFVEVVPTLTGWSAAGATIGSCMMLIAGIEAMIHTGFEKIHKDENVKFVNWILNSEKSEYIEIYKQWRKERKN